MLLIQILAIVYSYIAGMMIPDPDQITATMTSIHTSLGAVGDEVYLKRPDLLQCFEAMGKPAWYEPLQAL